MNGSLHQLALLKQTQLLRQHTLRYAGNGAFKLRESPDRAREEPVQNDDLPFAFENGERRLNPLGSFELEGSRPEI